MENEGLQPPAAPARELRRRTALLGIGAVAGIGAVDVGAFAYVSGRVTPDRLTPGRLADGFETVFGKHPGFRRNHAKGVSVAGEFVAGGAGAAVSEAVVFEEGRRTPVTGRFSLSGGVPDVADATKTVRGMALRFDLPDGEQWRTAMVNLPVFQDRTPQGFYDRMLAFRAVPDTGEPDPEKKAAFLAEHPETVRAMKLAKKHPPTSGFADSTFNSLNAFHFTNSSGSSVPVRWSMVALQPVRAAAKGPIGRNELFETLIGALTDGPLRWRLMLTIGSPEDPVDDATTPWPDSRRKLDAGVLTLTAVHTGASGNARDINFDPTVLPRGIKASSDPLLSARSSVYAQSFARRTGEPDRTGTVKVAGKRDD
ncbi:catalase family peroxidase [Streptomyces sp. AC512_CC834]|uniref:catalase family peroxidase n=1 Tax=Streptomyces sp. AC512_CC834 TaxID=2823691 RepID=UPI001C25EA55|nr:catalase family peroxidase [Streptomyces sp. AC512_CC834]